MNITFSERSQKFQAGIFAVLNEKKMELEKAGKTIYNLSSPVPSSFHSELQRCLPETSGIFLKM